MFKLEKTAKFSANNLVQFQYRLKKSRKSLHLTQKQLADMAGISERAIQNYELGVREPSLSVLISIANALNCGIDYLVGRTDNPNSHKS